MLPARIPSTDVPTMSSRWLEVLRESSKVSELQLERAEQLATQQHMLIEHALILLRLCFADDISAAKIAAYATDEIVAATPRDPLWMRDIPPEVVECLPESVCRENDVLPLVNEADRLVVAVAADHALDLIEKLRFILNKRIETRLAWPDDIRRAIDHYYGRQV
jgi:type IV pilus assembly protein PilB